jgi:hypothetical protein
VQVHGYVEVTARAVERDKILLFANPEVNEYYQFMCFHSPLNPSLVRKNC